MKTVLLSWGQRGASHEVSMSAGPCFLLCFAWDDSRVSLLSFYVLLREVMLGSPKASHLAGPQCTHLPRTECKPTSAQSGSIFTR